MIFFKKGEKPTFGNAMVELRDDLISLCYECRTAIPTSKAGPIVKFRQTCPSCDNKGMLPHAVAPESFGKKNNVRDTSDFKMWNAEE